MSTSKPKKDPPAYLFALGKAPLPETVDAQGTRWQFAKLYKHDFFAATALYQQAKPAPGSTPRLAVLKVQRTYPLFGFPMKWLGRRVARHEIRIYQELQGVPGVPDFLGEIGPTGFLHAFVPGEDLRPDMPFTPAFFDQLAGLLRALHDRNIAYVDTNKRENILFGEDGRPWLIDFQISFFRRPGWRNNILTRWWLRRFQRADWYHFYKHKTRLLPSACTEEDFAAAQRRGFLHELHRKIARPITDARRKFLSRYHLEKVK